MNDVAKTTMLTDVMMDGAMLFTVIGTKAQVQDAVFKAQTGAFHPSEFIEAFLWAPTHTEGQKALLAWRKIVVVFQERPAPKPQPAPALRKPLVISMGGKQQMVMPDEPATGDEPTDQPGAMQ